MVVYQFKNVIKKTHAKSTPTICNYYLISVSVCICSRATHNLKMNCPDTEHTDIEVTLADLLPSLKICSSDNFYEGKNVSQSQCWLMFGVTSVIGHWYKVTVSVRFMFQ